MNRNNVTAILIVLVILIVGWWYLFRPKTEVGLTLSQAKIIAQNSECVQKGTIGENGTYNQNSKTWWIDFTPNPQYAQNLCNPACVVSEASNTAEIDWRCTTAIKPASKDDLIVLDTPLPQSSVQSPLKISGRARGSWYFEASFPVKLYDAKHKLISQTVAQAQSDWMTNDYVPFTATLTFISTTANGTLVLEKDNPSGLPQNENQLAVPITFTSTVPATTEVGTHIKLYYYNPALDQGPGGAQCSEKGLVAVERVIPATTTPLKASIELLLKGELTPAERAQGITTEFPLTGVSLKSATLNQGVATLTFNDPQNKTGGGSCRTAVLWAQIEKTAKQFSSITSVRFMPTNLFQP
jgi:hypothetical protein